MPKNVGSSWSGILSQIGNIGANRYKSHYHKDNDAYRHCLNQIS